MNAKTKNLLKKPYQLFLMPLVQFFGELIRGCKGRRLTILWIAAIFFAGYAGSEFYIKKLQEKIGFAIDISNISSNDHIFFKIDKKAKTYSQLNKGDYVAFSSDLLTPFVRKDATVVKKVVGMKGDHVQIVDGVVSINGEKLAVLLPDALIKLKKTKEQFNADFIIPDDKLFVLGSYERSYDSRYWGLLPMKKDEKIGIATPVLF
ncbi:signal peptidase I [Acinetobacter sp. ANC 5380]|uniref:Signal peptidase I n=1 Tax=Acinetobacter terrae TaxID=2731247 RepID=A0A7Y2RIQ5_9GAMM|nr:signal peptidase I [Acinetobacter terrae]NNH79196.1 signal peptidase I [Acinetobacter terrae]